MSLIPVIVVESYLYFSDFTEMKDFCSLSRLSVWLIVRLSSLTDSLCMFNLLESNGERYLDEVFPCFCCEELIELSGVPWKRPMSNSGKGWAGDDDI